MVVLCYCILVRIDKIFVMYEKHPVYRRAYFSDFLILRFTLRIALASTVITFFFSFMYNLHFEDEH